MQLIFKCMFSVLLSIALLFVVVWAGALMFGTWTMVADGATFVYNYGTGIGTTIIAVTAVIGLWQGFERFRDMKFEFPALKLTPR